MMMMAGSSSLSINGKVVPDGKPSGGCEGLPLICIVVDTLGMGILGQGGGGANWRWQSTGYI